jgi:mono/diheme cytochrome c family protein
VLVAGGALLAEGEAGWAGEPVALQFSRHAEPVTTLDLASLREAVPSRGVRVFEPYEGREIGFEALAFAAVLDAAYTTTWRTQEELLFTCSDGYQPTVPVQRVLDHKAWLAFARSEDEPFSILKLESGRPQRIELSPFYLVWENLDDAQVRQEGDYGWPYQLIAVDLIRAQVRFPRMAPPSSAGEHSRSGFKAFRVHCSRCHAINGEGGSIGPDLNVPFNPVEVREKGWLYRWIDDPSQINPASRMPRINPALERRGEAIDDIIAYLEVMAAARRGSR